MAIAVFPFLFFWKGVCRAALDICLFSSKQFVRVDCKPYFSGKQTTMKKEIENHIKHLEVTMERLFTTIYTDDELKLIYLEEDHICENISLKKAWVKQS